MKLHKPSEKCDFVDESEMKRNDRGKSLLHDAIKPRFHPKANHEATDAPRQKPESHCHASCRLTQVDLG